MPLKLTWPQRIAYLFAWALGAGLLLYVAWGWVSAPVGCDVSCEVYRRGMAAFVGVVVPLFADLLIERNPR